jgi:hypothetical protein
MPPSIETVQSWQGRTMVDPAGDKLGTIDAIYLDDETGQPEWATVTGGMFIAKTAFVSLRPRTPATASRCPTASSRSRTPPAWRPTGASPRTTRPSCTATTASSTASTAPTAACPVNLAGIAAHLASGAVLFGANKGRVASQPGVAKATVVKTALTGAVLVLNARMGEQQRPAQVTSGLLGRLQPGRSA